MVHYKLGKSDKESQNDEQLFKGYVIHTITSPQKLKGEKRKFCSLLEKGEQPPPYGALRPHFLRSFIILPRFSTFVNIVYRKQIQQSITPLCNLTALLKMAVCMFKQRKVPG